MTPTSSCRFAILADGSKSPCAEVVLDGAVWKQTLMQPLELFVVCRDAHPELLLQDASRSSASRTRFRLFLFFVSRCPEVYQLAGAGRRGWSTLGSRRQLELTPGLSALTQAPVDRKIPSFVLDCVSLSVAQIARVVSFDFLARCNHDPQRSCS